MKTIFQILIFFISLISNAQTDKVKPQIYITLGGGLGLANGFKEELNLRYGRHIFYILLNEYSKKDPNTPEDYRPGTNFFNKKTYPYLFNRAISIGYGNVYKTNIKNVSYNLKGGISYNFTIIPTNYAPNSSTSSSWFGTTSSNYQYDHVEKKNFGIVLNPSVNITLSRVNGISFGLYSNLNKEFSKIQFDILLDFGRMRDKKEKI